MTTYTIDNSHSDVGFSVRHMVFAKVRGHFTKWTAQLAFDPADPAKSSVEVSIDAASIDTREAQRDTHLRSPDFLDVEKFPKLTYKSRKVEPAGDKKYKVAGDLTIHGVSRDVALEVEELGRGKDPLGERLHRLRCQDVAQPGRLRSQVEPGPGGRRPSRRRACRDRDRRRSCGRQTRVIRVTTR